MTISPATSAPLAYAPPTSTTAAGVDGCETAPTPTFVGGDAGAGAAAVVNGGGPATTQQALVDALRQALTALTQLITQLSGGSTTGGGAVGQMPGQFPGQFPGQYPGQEPGSQVGGATGAPQKSEVGGANGGPKQVPGQVGGAHGGPGQFPTQSPQQSPTQSPVQMDATATGGGPEGDVRLDESHEAVTLTAGNGDSVRIWGDPHVDVKIDGRTEKFDIGFGPGTITLADGTNISWDTRGPKKILGTFQIDRPGATPGDIAVDTGDTTTERGALTGLTDAQLREFLTELRRYEGHNQAPLRRH